MKLRARAIKQGLLSVLSAFLLHKTRDTPSRVNTEVSKSFDMNNWHIYQERVKIVTKKKQEKDSRIDSWRKKGSAFFRQGVLQKMYGY